MRMCIRIRFFCLQLPISAEYAFCTRYTLFGDDMPVVYIDVLFLLNLWIDFLLLSLTARLCRVPARRGRLVLGAVVGAALCVLLFLPPLSVWLSLVIRILGTVLLTVVTFRWYSWRIFWKLLIVFAMVSAVFSGVATALWYTVAPAGFMVVGGVVYYDAPASLLIVFTAISYAVILLYERLRRRTAPKNRVYILEIQENGKQLVCSLLYDSGCTLKEPFSGRAALVIDRLAAETLLPDGWLEDAALARACGVRFIPFETVGGEGALPAFCPERMIITDKKGGRFDVSGSFLAVSDALGHGEYTALCGTDIGDIIERG